MPCAEAQKTKACAEAQTIRNRVFVRVYTGAQRAASVANYLQTSSNVLKRGNASPVSPLCALFLHGLKKFFSPSELRGKGARRPAKKTLASRDPKV